MSDWVERYLQLLELSGIQREPPSLKALGRLCEAQVMTVPFENVTAILRRARTAEGPVPAVDTDAMLDTWQAHAGGGVCVDTTPTFRRLLLALGYETRPTMARITFPGSHQASVVAVDGAEYLVDVANGAPFFEPIPLDRETIISCAGLTWRFRRESSDLLVQDRHIGGAFEPFCHYALASADLASVEAAYQRHHTPGESWVVGNLTLVRCTDREVIRLRDDNLVRYSATGVVSNHLSQEHLPHIADELFGLPHLPVAQACEALLRIRSIRSASASL